MISFAEVIHYIAGYDPAFPQSISGATAEEIRHLESLINIQLPEVYRGFLAAMGRSTGWINIEEIDFSISTVISYYHGEGVIPAKHYLRIGSDTKDPSFNPHLTLYDYFPDMKVVLFGDCTPETLSDVSTRHRRYLAGSLQELFCRPVFHKFEFFGPERQPIALLGKECVNNQIRQLDQVMLEEFGLEPVLWSNDSSRGYTSPELALEAEQQGVCPLRIMLRAEHPEEQARVGQIISDRFNLMSS